MDVMAIALKFTEKIKTTFKGSYFLYPLIIIVTIPLLLIINTAWNLRSFNRDANFLIRHQAVSVADTIKPQLQKQISEGGDLDKLLTETKNANSEIVSLAVVSEVENKLEVVSSTEGLTDIEALQKKGLNQLAISINQPIAGLAYDPLLRKNAWNVSVPIGEIGNNNYLLYLRFRVDKVEEILGRTSRDSYIVLGILIVVTLALLINHFIFYRKAQKTRELEELDRLKDELISMAAHELRAPMTGLIGYLQLLKDKISPDQDKDTEEDFMILDILIQNLNKLINDLLDVSRIEQGRLKIEIKDTNVNEVIQNVIDTFTPLAGKKGLELAFSKNESVPLIKSDPDRIRQVITNLLSNAIKYSLQGKIEIKSEVKGKVISVEVKDSGIGIPPSQISSLFTKFFRVKDLKTNKESGTGLGLWITKRIVNLLGGEIYVESIYGTGSKFSFTLPLSI